MSGLVILVPESVVVHVDEVEDLGQVGRRDGLFVVTGIEGQALDLLNVLVEAKSMSVIALQCRETEFYRKPGSQRTFSPLVVSGVSISSTSECGAA